MALIDFPQRASPEQTWVGWVETEVSLTPKAVRVNGRRRGERHPHWTHRARQGHMPPTPAGEIPMGGAAGWAARVWTRPPARTDAWGWNPVMRVRVDWGGAGWNVWVRGACALCVEAERRCRASVLGIARARRPSPQRAARASDGGSPVTGYVIEALLASDGSIALSQQAGGAAKRRRAASREVGTSVADGWTGALSTGGPISLTGPWESLYFVMGPPHSAASKSYPRVTRLLCWTACCPS